MDVSQYVDCVLVTGGAGFLGSHLVDALALYGLHVKVLDNFSTGKLENISEHSSKPCFLLLRGDLLNPADAVRAVQDCSVIFHLAANPEVRVSSLNPEIHFNQNVVATYNLLEAVRRSRVELLVFTSSSTVYGEASTIPTPEDYGTLEPISVYGASKLACEALISAYAHTYGFQAIIYRLANIAGPRLRHGVIYDFITKLRSNPNELEVLGDGFQTKSYLFVSDFVDAVFQGMKGAKKQVEIFNVGSEDWINVKKIAEIVAQEMQLGHVKLIFTGGVDGGRGWKGDVKFMRLDISKLKSVGWSPRYTSEEAVKLTARSLIEELKQNQQGKQ